MAAVMLRRQPVTAVPVQVRRQRSQTRRPATRRRRAVSHSAGGLLGNHHSVFAVADQGVPRHDDRSWVSLIVTDIWTVTHAVVGECYVVLWDGRPSLG
jgi:hypothetical protein